MRDKLYICDNHFSHAYSSSYNNKPEKFDWVRDYNNDFIVLTDSSIYQVDSFKNKIKYAWLLESPEITRNSYNYIINNYNKFDRIFTFDKELLSISEKFDLVPIGGSWINNNEQKIYEKTKLVSMIMSSKTHTSGHKLRHNIFHKNMNIDIFGIINPIDNKISGLKDYMFSVVVENCKKDFYFTEKIIDCFTTGTIPIYWGCPSINNFFDIDGILTFNNIDELISIVGNLSKDLYESKLKSISYNFIESQKYLIADNIIYEKIKK